MKTTKPAKPNPSKSKRQPNPETSNPETPNPENENAAGLSVSVTVEKSPEIEGGFFADLISKAEAPREEKPRRAVTKKAEGDDLGDLPTMLSAVMVLVFSSVIKMDPAIKPNVDEINALCLPLSRIISRHVDTSNKLTGDALDAIGIISVMAGWYLRVSPALDNKPTFGPVKSQPAPIQETPPIRPDDPGGQLKDTATASFLERSATLASQRDE